jgi:hypothetical protein
MMQANTGAKQVHVDLREKAIQIVRNRGPLLPVQITKELGTNVLFASAMLSELVDRKILKLSNTKVGGSPVYYVVGQEPKLQALRDRLNDKQQKAFDILKQKGVLRDSEQEPVIRASLRDIKDFACPLQVSLGEASEIYWKWYLLSDAEAELLIKEKLGLNKRKDTRSKPPEKQLGKHEEVQKHLSEIERDLKKLEEKKQELLQKPIEQTAKERIVKKESTQRIKKELHQHIEQQASLKEEVVVDIGDKFMSSVIDYFKENKIELLSLKQIRRNQDFEGSIKIPSAVGAIQYFCKAKNKQKITDADLSLLFVQSQMRKMPILLITTGNITNKAQELLQKEFKNITIKKIEV